jgi:uncharacterized protein YprB with RNaseH-like and TPR domain
LEAKFLTPNAPGLSTLTWRSQFEQFEDPALKRKLITYNAEDCQALEMVSKTVWTVLDQKPCGPKRDRERE